MKWKIRFAVALIFMALGKSAWAEPNPQRIYRKALPSVMMLEVENQAGDKFIGSGVLALGDDIAVTAWHVVWDARSVWATFADGSRVRVLGCIDQDGERDLALLKLEKRLPERRSELNDHLQPVAARAYVIGAPKGYGFSISDGLISQIRSVDGFAQYQVSCPISPGNSGGPVLDERGRVIGIVSWTKSDAQSVSFAIPSREVARLNPARRTTPWAELSFSARPPLAARLVDADRPVSLEGDGQHFLPHGYESLAHRLEQSSGKKVTVVVREDGVEDKFTFTVPRHDLSGIK